MLKKSIILVFFLAYSFGLAAQQAEEELFLKMGPPGTAVLYSLKEALKDPPMVYKLDLTDQLIEPKQINKLNKFSNLQALKLISNQLDSIPIGFSKAGSMVYFYSKNNPIKSIPSWCDAWNQLMYLRLIDCRIDTLPETIGAWGQLRSIQLQNNKSEKFKLRKEIKYWKNLQELIIYNSPLDTLPAQIGDLVKLKSLIIIKSNLNYLPPNLNHCKQLEELVLDDNVLINYPEAINYLYDLRYLSLKNNQIKKVSEFISNLQKLKTLDLRGNPIDEYDLHVLKILLPNCDILH